jgi:hypothetical protein
MQHIFKKRLMLVYSNCGSQKYEKVKDRGQRTAGSFMKTAGSLRLLK